MTNQDGLRSELEHIRRTADMLCTGHAGLRDRFARMALILDVTILCLTGWLTALAFVAPQLNMSLTPFRLDPQLWTGLISILVLFLAIIQLKTDWKGRSDAHRRTLDIYAEIKREAGYLLASGESRESACRRIFTQYDMASVVGIEMPERYFLREKRRHKLKIALSKYLDTHPGASIVFTRWRFWMRDNFRKMDPHA